MSNSDFALAETGYTDEQREFYQFELNRTWPWLHASMTRYGAPTHTESDVWEMIDHGRAQLWPTPHAAILTTINTHPTGLREINGWLAGGDLNEIVAIEPLLERCAQASGCSRVLIFGREGWLRAFKDYRKIGTCLAKDF